MAPRRRPGTLIRMLSAAAAAAAAVLVAVALLAPAPRPPESVVSAQPTPPAGADSAALLPSYVVRIPPPAPAGAERAPAPVTLSVQPVAAPAEPGPATEKWYVTARALNVRSEPNSQSQPVGALPRGTAVAVSETQGNWVQVTAGDVTGWAFVKYLSQTPP